MIPCPVFLPDREYFARHLCRMEGKTVISFTKMARFELNNSSFAGLNIAIIMDTLCVSDKEGCMKIISTRQSALPVQEPSVCRADAKSSLFARFLSDSARMVAPPSGMKTDTEKTAPKGTEATMSAPKNAPGPAAQQPQESHAADSQGSFSVEKIVMTLEKQMQEEARGESVRKGGGGEVSVVFSRNTVASNDRWDRFRMSSAMAGRQDREGKGVFLGLRIGLG